MFEILIWGVPIWCLYPLLTGDAFKKDRELANKCIYKILDLMDRNYDINNIDETILAKLTVESNEICQKK